MKKSMATNLRSDIIETYARWTALSATRSGSPIKSRVDVYTALSGVAFKPLFDMRAGRIEPQEFDRWHRREVAGLKRRDQRLNVGWATKLLNVYLKTRAYIGAEGRAGLSDAIHPPIDAGLWEGIAVEFAGRNEILDLTHCVGTIRGIQDYACYSQIVAGCRKIAAERGCRLIEVEQFWRGADIPA